MLPPGCVKLLPALEYVAGRCRNLEYVLIVQETGARKKYASGVAISSMSFLYLAAVPFDRWNFSSSLFSKVSWMIKASSPMT